MRLADSIFERLKQEVDTVFYLPGGMCSPLVDALGRSGLQAICNLHEQGAGFAAVGYAQVHGFGVCLTTSGPGATNAMTPCLAAWMDSVPVLFISGTVPMRWTAYDGMRSRGTQEGRTIEMIKSITKFSVSIKTADHCLDMLHGEIQLAKAGRMGPTWLEIPQDIQLAEI